MRVPEVTRKCPIPHVSKDCEGCLHRNWRECVYVKLWIERKKGKPTKTRPYYEIAKECGLRK